MRPRTASIALVLLLTSIAAAAQERELHWRKLDVVARLDADGVLHVREVQEMVFTGDWNGGERVFRVETRQRLAFGRLLRVDPAASDERVLQEGSLGNVDEWKWADSRTLRWRSRLPSDPPFNATSITYVLEYSMSHLLVPEGDTYVLNHDFVFPDRNGDIEDFTLSLDIDAAWNAGRPVPVKTRQGPLSPGEGYVLRIPLKRIAAGEPAAVSLSAPERIRRVLAALLLAGLLALAFELFRKERALGRFAPLLPAGSIDRSWIEANILCHAPEVVGAAWDDRTSAPEVAAILARLVSEKKIVSRVERTGFGPFKRDVLHLTLKTSRVSLAGHEKPLIDGLFVAGEHTSTDIVRKHYRRSGFDPASKISEPLRRRADTILPPKAAGIPKNWPLNLALIAASAALIVAGGLQDPSAWVVAPIAAAAAAPVYVIGLLAAYRWRDRVHNVGPVSLTFIIPSLMLAGGMTALLLSGWLRLNTWTLAGLSLLAYTLLRTVFKMGESRDGVERIGFRKRLAAGREYFQGELAKQAPALSDEWYPWLIAFGLGSNVDRWFRSFGGSSGSSISTSSFGSGSASRSPSGWSGGGGAFGGAGASASWAAAAGSMATGVASSSSSSSSGGGGGSSSGGGGGGGW